MQLGVESQIPDGLLAANALLAENSRQGVPSSTHTLHPDSGFAISSTYKGFQFRCYEGASDPVVAPNNAPTPTPQPCLAQRVGNALPGAQFTGVGNAVGGHQQFNFAVNTADLAADGFTPFKVLGLFSNGYRNGSFYLQVHVNGQNGAQLGDSSGIINVQGHIDVFNPAAGYGTGLILHGIWDLGIGSLFFHHRASLDPGCHS